MKPRSERHTSGEKALTRGEYDKVLAKIDNLEDELMLRLAVSTGIRREDLFNIKIADIDLDEEKPKLVFYESKKRRSRSIDLELPVAQLIRKFLKTIVRKRELLFSFTGRTGWTHFNDWCEAAGVERRPFHTLRATCAKFCQKAGRSPESTAKLLGDNLETVQIYYQTPSADEMAEDAKERPIA